MHKILVTGANGFVGKVVCEKLSSRGFDVVAAIRDPSGSNGVASNGAIHAVAVGNIDEKTDWMAVLNGCSSVIHLAARAHVLSDTTADPLAAFRETNVDGALQLARSAMLAGVRRFVFVSSVGVNGQRSSAPFTETDTPQPAEPYAVSKLEAELALRKITSGSSMQLVIVRPPLVYGPECPGNFLRLLKLLSAGIPLPFGAIRGKRSFIGVWNLADFLITCVLHEKAAGNLFLVSDMEDIALPDLLRRLAEGMGKEVPLFSFNPVWLGRFASIVGRAGMFEKLCGSLTVDPSHAHITLDWTPPISLTDGLCRTADWYAQR